MEGYAIPLRGGSTIGSSPAVDVWKLVYPVSWVACAAKSTQSGVLCCVSASCMAEACVKWTVVGNRSMGVVNASAAGQDRESTWRLLWIDIVRR